MKWLAALLICFVSLVPSLAQDAPPVITPENAASLNLIESAGSALPAGVKFSPDGRYILAMTTDETFVFPADDPDAAPQIFPFNQIAFDADGYLIGGGQRWNLDTGQSIGIPPSITVIRDAIGDPAVIEVVKPGGETIRVETDIKGTVSLMSVDNSYFELTVAEDSDFLPPRRIRFYNLPEGDLITVLPLIGSYPVTALINTALYQQDFNALLVITMADSDTTQGYAALFFPRSGQLYSEFSGEILLPLATAPSGIFAYGLEGKIVYGTNKFIHSIPYSGNPESLIIGDRGIAVVTDDGFHAALFGEFGILGEFVEYDSYSGFSIAPRFAGEHIFFTMEDALWIWNVASPDAKPRKIEIEHGTHDIAFNPDLERYSYRVDDRRFVRDASTGELLAELPINAVISPDWSRAAYFDGKPLTVRDLTDEQSYTRELIPGHLGEVADFQNGFAAYIGDALQVVDLDPTDGLTDAITISGSFNGAYFFNRGACIVTLALGEDGSTAAAIHSLNSDAACKEATYSISTHIDSAFVTRSGSYLVGYDIVCGSDYWMPETRVFPLKGYVNSGLQTNFSIYACGMSSIAFSHDETTVYVANSSPVLRGTKSFSPDKVIGEPDLEALLIYADPVEDSFAIISGVFLSPDEEKIAIYVEDSNVANWVQERHIEVFALADLEPGTLRRDVRPLRTIPDATVAYFSPYGRYVATDKGLYSVAPFNEGPAVNGSISAFSPDSQLLATYQGGFVTLWRVQHTRAINYPLAQYKIGGVRELAFSQDRTRLYVVRAGEVQVWGVAHPAP